MKPLTPRMKELLKVLAENEERVIYMPYRGRFNPHAYYFSFGISRGENGGTRCTREAQGLMDRGLALKKVTNQYSGDHDLTISEAGKLVYAELYGDGETPNA